VLNIRRRVYSLVVCVDIFDSEEADVGLFAEVYLGPITLDMQTSLKPLACSILLSYALLLADQADSVT